MKKLLILTVSFLLISCSSVAPGYNPNLYFAEPGTNPIRWRRCVLLDRLEEGRCLQYDYLSELQVRNMILTAPASFNAVIEMQKQCYGWRPEK